MQTKIDLYFNLFIIILIELSTDFIKLNSILNSIYRSKTIKLQTNQLKYIISKKTFFVANDLILPLNFQFLIPFLITFIIPKFQTSRINYVILMQPQTNQENASRNC